MPAGKKVYIAHMTIEGAPNAYVFSDADECVLTVATILDRDGDNALLNEVYFGCGAQLMALKTMSLLIDETLAALRSRHRVPDVAGVPLYSS